MVTQPMYQTGHVPEGLHVEGKLPPSKGKLAPLGSQDQDVDPIILSQDVVDTKVLKDAT